MNICQVCKTENDADSKFCKNCGSEIIIDVTKSDVEDKDALTTLIPQAIKKNL